jgi:hypothetical protein
LEHFAGKMSREWLPGLSHRLLATVWALAAIAVCLDAAAAETARAPTMRLRIEWSAETPSLWAGRVTIGGGRFEQPQSLAQAGDDAGTITIEGGMLSVCRHSARTNDGLEVSVTASPGSRLEIALQDQRDSRSPQAIHLSPADCFHKLRVFAADGNRPRVVVRRAPGDALGVSFDRPSLVFDPGESLRIGMTLNLLDAREGSDRPARVLLKWKLLAAGANRPINEGSTTVAGLVNPTTPVDVPLELRLPREEGVYNLRLAASGLGFTDVERLVQLVVVDPARSGESPNGAREKLVDSFEPSPANLFRKVSVASLRPKSDRGRSRFPATRSTSNAAADERGGPVETSTVAYKLRASHPGRPHRLEVALTARHEQVVSVTLWQADAEDQLVPCGPAERFPIAGPQPRTSRLPGDSHSDACVVRQFFWPVDRDVVVSIESPRAGGTIDVTRVRLYDLGETLLAGETDPWMRAGLELPRRHVGRYLHKPILPENFGAPQHYDAADHLRLDDWQTFLVAGRRVTDWLRYQRQSALMLAVYADGTPLYPSQRLDPSLLYDNGRLAPSGQDPAPKDILELLLRLFDREDLALIPEMQFDAPLPDLERLLQESAELREDLLLVDAEGRTRTESRGAAGVSHPGYNILSPRVQQAVLDVVHELMQRYKAHPALAGVAFELSPASILQFPGIEWGYDRQTIRRFEQATQIRVPGGEERQWRREACRFLTTAARREWLRFRAAEVARFHERLAEVVTRASPDARVIFSGHLGPLGDSDSEPTLLSTIRAGRNPAQLLMAEGLDFSQGGYAAERNVTVLRPVVQSQTANPLAQAALTTFNASPAVDALYRGGGRGGLVYSIDDGRRESPGSAATGSGPVESGQAVRSVSHATAARRRYAHLLAALDARLILDGGSVIPLTPDDETMRLRQTIARLPAIPFQPAGPQVQPVSVRAAHTPQETFVYAVNDSPLTLTVEMLLDCPASTPCRTLDSGKLLPLEAAGDSAKSRLRVELKDYDALGYRLERSRVEVRDTRLNLHSGSLAEVQQRIESLTARMNAVTGLALAGSRSLPNPGFEQPGSGETVLPGWELPVLTAGWTLDDENPRSGQRSLLLSAERKRPLLESPDLALDGSRFVTMSLWMRSSKPAARVELGFDARIGAEPFRQEAIVEVGKAWKQYSFRVDQLPAGPVQEARLRVKPIDSCKLWIDDVDIDAQSFSADEVRQLTKTLSSVKLAWEEGRYADCQRLLDGYWGQLLLSEPVAPPVVPPVRARLSERVKNALRR